MRGAHQDPPRHAHRALTSTTRGSGTLAHAIDRPRRYGPCESPGDFRRCDLLAHADNLAVSRVGFGLLWVLVEKQFAARGSFVEST